MIIGILNWFAIIRIGHESMLLDQADLTSSTWPDTFQMLEYRQPPPSSHLLTIVNVVVSVESIKIFLDPKPCMSSI